MYPSISFFDEIFVFFFEYVDDVDSTLRLRPSSEDAVPFVPDILLVDAQ
jgi:hypothetical protein